MAANMPQMAPNGQQMMIPRQLQPIVYQALLATSQSAGWQAAVPIPDRLGKAMNLITNCILAAPGQEWQSAVRWGIDVEKRAFLNSPDRPTYESHIAVQVNEMAKKRQANAPDLQNQMSSEAARQSQLQAQQQQLLMNQMKGMGQPVQQGLQHLQHQMQPSPIPQQTQQQMGMGMGNPAMLQNRLNQQQFGMTPQQPRPPNSVPTDMNQLSPAERRTLQEVAQKLLNSTPEPQKAQQRAELMQKMNPQLLQEMQNSGRDPLLFVYQQKAFTNMQRQAQLRIMQQRGQGLPPNMDPAQAQAMLLRRGVECRAPAIKGSGYPRRSEGGRGEDQSSMEDDEYHGDEPRYCYCNNVSYGEMVACDADGCPREWFHLECVGLKDAPRGNAKWYCEDCKK